MRRTNGTGTKRKSGDARAAWSEKGSGPSRRLTTALPSYEANEWQLCSIELGDDPKQQLGVQLNVSGQIYQRVQYLLRRRNNGQGIQFLVEYVPGKRYHALTFDPQAYADTV